MTVDANGVQLATELANAGGGAMALAGGLIYGDSGNIVDPATDSVVRVFNPFDFLHGMVPDTGLQKLFAYGEGPNSAVPELRSFDLATYAPLATIPIPTNVTPVRIARWGTDGFAIAGQYLIIVNGPAVAP